MPFYKNCIKKDCNQKYGFEQGAQAGFFAHEPIKKGQLIYECDQNQCDYFNNGEKVIGKTKEQTLEIFKQQPHLKDFIQKYAYMLDDDLFAWPKEFLEQRAQCQCLYFNHSCDPNLGHESNDLNKKIAIKDIDVGEELTLHYTYFDTENSLDNGTQCKCGSGKCVGVLKFDEYRNIDWQNQFLNHTSEYVRRKIETLKTKWYSTKCFVKYYFSSNEENSKQVGLTCLCKLEKNELVATFSNQVRQETHFIRHSEMPTCYLDKYQVFSIDRCEPLTELTLNYNLIKE